MRSWFAQYALVGLIACYSLPASAADNSEPVNPFEQPSPGNRTVSASISDEPDSDEKRGFSLPKFSLPMPTLPKPRMPNFSLPKLQMPKVSMPQWTERNPSRNAGPSTWQKLNSGTKNMFSKTRDTLMPWAANDHQPPVRHATGSRASTGITRTRVASNRGNDSTTSGEKKSIFSSFLPASEPEDNPIRTTSDFLSQKRPLLD